VGHWLDIRHLLPAALLLAGACSGPPLILPAPPPPVPAVASSAVGRAVLTLAASTPTVPPEVQVRDDTIRYPITGSTMSEIARQLGIGRGNSDSDYVGATAAKVQWQFAPKRHGDTCAISDVLVTLDIQTRLPEWVHPEHVPVTLIRQWSAFLDATQQHENGHRNIALHTAVAIARSLMDEHGLACAELDQLANASAHAEWELGNQHQITYDAATRNGETQGSRWPPFLDRPAGTQPAP